MLAKPSIFVILNLNVISNELSELFKLLNLVVFYLWLDTSWYRGLLFIVFSKVKICVYFISAIMFVTKLDNLFSYTGYP
jgi:hypothetical protein